MWVYFDASAVEFLPDYEALFEVRTQDSETKEFETALKRERRGGQMHVRLVVAPQSLCGRTDDEFCTQKRRNCAFKTMNFALKNGGIVHSKR